MSTMTPADREAVVAKTIQDVNNIATLPEITLKIIDLVEDPNSTAHDLHSLITNDPALCSRILKVVNSAFYGLPGQIGSINRAIVLLGLNAVKNIAIATSLAKLFRGGSLCPQFSARDLWVHCTAVAAGAKLIADTSHLSLSDEAFLAGLLHDIGIMIEMQTSRTKLIEVFDMAEKGVPFMEAEERIFGANHQDFGRGLCEKWKFPGSFGYVTGFHHRVGELAAGQRTLTAVIHIADHLAKRHEIGFTADIEGDMPDQAALQELNLSVEQLNAISDALPESIEQVEAMLGN